MSEDQFSESFDEPNMEISVETLTGTSFDMRVYSHETVLHIKNKIQRVEGIPVHHQNLLFRMKELDDYKTLGEVGIVNGSTLKLVLSMRGGPISTRRLSSCEHRVAWKDIKDLIEQAREEISENGSKISLFVFKEGDMVNLLRIIENENGSYSPYTETAADDIDENISVLFDKLVEDNEMLRKISKVRKKIESVSTRRHLRNSRPSGEANAIAVEKLTETEEPVDEEFGKSAAADSKCVGQERLMYRVLKEFNDFAETHLQVQENSFKVFVNDPPSEVQELALKEKHRSKFGPKQSAAQEGESKPKSLYSESKGSFSLTREKYLSVGLTKSQQKLETEIEEEVEDEGLEEMDAKGSEASSCGDGVHNGSSRLLIPESPDRSTVPQNSLEIEKDGELWDVTFLKRLRNVDYNFDVKYNVDVEPTSSEQVYRQNFYQLPQFISTPGTKEEQMCDYLLGNQLRNEAVHRSPLYGRRSQTNAGDSTINTFNKGYEKISKGGGGVPILPRIHQYSSNCGGSSTTNFPSGASNIERLRNEFDQTKDSDALEEVCGFYNVACASAIYREQVLSPLQLKTSSTTSVDEKDERDAKIQVQSIKLEDLPAVKKKQLRCNQCNKRLNISNNYTCRCGRLFCAQHRYSEVHNCKFDYKTEGRVILERQNPLVVAEKLSKF